MNSKHDVLEAYNQLQSKTSKCISFEEAKGRDIFKERQDLEKRFDKKLVEEVFGEPGHLEEAERMLCLIETNQKWHSVETIAEILVNISYRIAFACDEKLHSSNKVYEKYASLYSMIPIYLLEFNDNQIEYNKCKVNQYYISTEELKKLKVNLSSSYGKNDSVQLAYFSYIVEAVHESLKNIFVEVKQEIMGD